MFLAHDAYSISIMLGDIFGGAIRRAIIHDNYFVHGNGLCEHTVESTLYVPPAIKGWNNRGDSHTAFNECQDCFFPSESTICR